jgi:hypothetical protein
LAQGELWFRLFLTVILFCVGAIVKSGVWRS